MNLDKNKILKALATLAALFVLIIGISKVIQNHSVTLTEYAEEHPELMNQEETEETLTVETPEESEKLTNSTENLQNEETEETFPTISTLIGASLNGDTVIEQRISYTKDFYYEPLSDNLRRYITGVSFPSTTSPSNGSNPETGDSEDLNDTITTAGPAITYDELRYVHILHYDFDGNLAEGELICNKAIAQDLVEIFYELYRNEYHLERVRLIDEYDGDDTSSMEDNNTSCFNYREVAGSTSLSKHALGLAIDINPLYNPYITYEEDGSENISPVSAVPYADRDVNFPYKIDEKDLCYKLFTEHGFTWGGNWNSCKDYQHFQKTK